MNSYTVICQFILTFNLPFNIYITFFYITLFLLVHPNCYIWQKRIQSDMYNPYKNILCLLREKWLVADNQCDHCSKYTKTSKNGIVQTCDKSILSENMAITITSVKNTTPSKVRSFDKNLLQGLLNRKAKCFVRILRKWKKNTMMKGCSTF